MNFIKFCTVASGIQCPKVHLVFALFKARTKLLISLAYSIWLRPLTLNLTWIGIQLQFVLLKNTQNYLMLSRKLLTFRHCIKGQNLVCNELATLKILDDVSESLFNVCITFGARENSAPDGELTDQNLWFFSLTPWLFMLSLRMNKQTKFQQFCDKAYSMH